MTTWAILDYSPPELLTSVEILLPTHLDRFQQVLLPQSMHGFTSSMGVGDVTRPSVNPEVYDALTHPAMWFALLRLIPEDQSRLFDGDLEKLDMLADQFLLWFYEKVKRRCPDWRHNFHDVVETLQEVAYLTAHTTVIEFPDTIWKNLKVSGHGLKGGQVDRLFNEAESAGLIRGDRKKRTWYWRHPFVRRYLAKEAREGEISS